MRVTINRADNRVTVDGETYTVDLSSLPAYVSVIQWFGTQGHVEFVNDGRGQFLPNISIADFAPYAYVIDMWKTSKTQEEERIAEEKRKQREEQEALNEERQRQLRQQDNGQTRALPANNRQRRR